MARIGKELNNDNQAENMVVESIGIDEEETRAWRLGDEDRDEEEAMTEVGRETKRETR
jgi:beta-lactamase class A